MKTPSPEAPAGFGNYREAAAARRPGQKVQCVGKACAAPIRGGKWMEHPDLSEAFWAPVELAPAHLKALAACYCSSLPDSTCDFCAFRRNPPNC